MTVITEAFKNAAAIRANVLGMPGHPTVIIEHPLANKTENEMSSMAEHFVDLVASALVLKP